MAEGNKDTTAPWEETAPRERGRRRALSSTRSRDRRAGADWDDGLIALAPIPATLTSRGAFSPVVLVGVGPHGYAIEIERLACPELGAEIHVGIPATPVEPGLLTVVGTVVASSDGSRQDRRRVAVALARHGGVPAAYWDVVTHWAEQA